MPESRTELPCGTCFGPGEMLGAERDVHVRVLADGRLQAPSQPLQSAFAGQAGRYVFQPQLLLAVNGNPWVAVQCLLGEGATRRRGVGVPPHLLRRAVVDDRPRDSRQQGPLEHVDRFGGLRRRQSVACMADGQSSRQRPDAPRPIRFEIFVARTESAESPGVFELSEPEPPSVEAAPGHAGEAGGLAAIRAYRAEIHGREAQIVRGDLHRHTELSWDAGGRSTAPCQTSTAT